ncbi:MAG: cytochrome c biogenesis factor, partial [Cyanobacteria bacterium J06659_2]
RLAIAVALFAQGDRTTAIEMGTEALERDSRYADIDFLDENLWGSDLLTATQTFFNIPEMTALIAQL